MTELLRTDARPFTIQELHARVCESTRSSCETAAPEIAGIGGEESLSKHVGGGSYDRAA